MPSPNSGGRGFTLVEAIIAAFLLLTSLLVVAALVDSTLRTQRKTEQYLMASMVASNELDKLRSYANRFGMRELDGFDGQTFDSQSDLAFRVKLGVTRHQLLLPNSSLESMVDPAERKVFEDSARRVVVTVSWSPDPDDSVKLVSLIGDWRPADFEVVVTPEAGAGADLELAPDETLRLGATSGEIPDIVFTWYTEPLEGLGSILEVDRDGRKASYVNHYRTPANKFDYYPGKCRVVVRAQYRNVVKTGTLEVTNVP